MLPLTTMETTPHQDLAQDMTMTTMENGSDTTAASIQYSNDVIHMNNSQ